MKSNIFDTALIFEGGGMRGAFSAGISNALLENGIYFDYVAGLSAGASLTVNYIEQNPYRNKSSFVDLVRYKEFGGINHWVRGKGYFNSEWIYEGSQLPEGVMPFDYERFSSNPATWRIGAFDRDSGEMVYWGKEDVKSVEDVMVRVRASSTLPFIMNDCIIDGKYYVDGGLSGGIAMQIAQEEGFRKFFIIRTRERGYLKPEMIGKRTIRQYFHKKPLEAEAVLGRPTTYNQLTAEIAQLEESGAAFVVYPEFISIPNTERNVEKLDAYYELGYYQATRDMKAYKRWLGL